MDPWTSRGSDPWTNADGQPQEENSDPWSGSLKNSEKEGVTSSAQSSEADPWASNVDPWSASSSSSPGKGSGTNGSVGNDKNNGKRYDGDSPPANDSGAWSKFGAVGGSPGTESTSSNSAGTIGTGSSSGSKGKGKGKGERKSKLHFSGSQNTFRSGISRRRGAMRRPEGQEDDSNVSIWDVFDELLEVFISGGFLRAVAIVFVAALTFRVWMLQI
eukprot:gnl/MRDRNA2_/MRDRNA2_123351_c0_seq1.p1 gnl/MRDRNA2_/MRDRNA2_123351_c0~~gnl/MRDRNA2_/MRDRNA2_123351_c0_seq1.p1  ORF type:complete len:216 (-),score=35.54 gnl/MRDRNA2_/MRDRNA2_123351_c0_seq1:11-658(-)